MANSSSVGMFNIPNFIGGSSSGLRSSSLGGSSGSLVSNPFGGNDPQGREIGAPGTGLPGVRSPLDPCVQTLIATGQPTPCPPGQQHDPPGSCGPCSTIGTPADPPTGDPTLVTQTPGETPQQSSCPEPTSPNPGKPGSHTWNTSTCTWDLSLQVSPTRGITPEDKKIRDIVGGSMQYGSNRGAQSRQELGQFGRAGGGVGGGAMGDMEVFTNPLLAGGSPYLEKNVSQFAYGGKMRDNYNYGGKMKNPYKYPGGGRADFMTGVKKGMNSVFAAEQIKEVVKNNRSSRRFTSGGKF